MLKKKELIALNRMHSSSDHHQCGVSILWFNAIRDRCIL